MILSIIILLAGISLYALLKPPVELHYEPDILRTEPAVDLDRTSSLMPDFATVQSTRSHL